MPNEKKLSDLSGKEQEDIVAARLEGTKFLQQYAALTMDPIALAACELDAQARLVGLHIEYSEEVEDEEL